MRKLTENYREVLITPRRNSRSLELHTAGGQDTYAVVKKGTKDIMFETTNLTYALQVIRKS
jgi:hypothetical protein